MKKTVMIVDDSLFVYEEMKSMLQDTEFVIAAYVKSGEDAIEKYGEVCPDIVTMDVILPGLDGINTSEEILKRAPDAKIIVVSSLAYDDTIERAKSIGAKAFLYKPIGKKALIDALNDALA